MACGGCDTSSGLTKEQVENLINKLVEEGKVQAGLKDCEGNDLAKGAKLVLCSALADAVNGLIEAGKIDVVTDVKVEDGKLVVTDGKGKENKTDLPYVKGVAGDKGVVLTLPDGTTVEVPKSGSALTEDSFDHTIEKGANKADKFGVKIKDNAGLTSDLDGISIKTGNGVKVDENGNIALDKSQASDGLAGSGLVAENGQLKVATVRITDASGKHTLGYGVDVGA